MEFIRYDSNHSITIAEINEDKSNIAFYFSPGIPASLERNQGLRNPLGHRLSLQFAIGSGWHIRRGYILHFEWLFNYSPVIGGMGTKQKDKPEKFLYPSNFTTLSCPGCDVDNFL
jgi:hypothetical protein